MLCGGTEAGACAAGAGAAGSIAGAAAGSVEVAAGWLAAGDAVDGVVSCAGAGWDVEGCVSWAKTMHPQANRVRINPVLYRTIFIRTF